ncbi:MAG: hypothetical protein RL616_355, partial [Verrucomicrobiota bacterium]
RILEASSDSLRKGGSPIVFGKAVAPVIPTYTNGNGHAAVVSDSAPKNGTRPARAKRVSSRANGRIGSEFKIVLNGNGK